MIARSPPIDKHRKRKFNDLLSSSDDEEVLGGTTQPLLNEKTDKKGLAVNLNLSPPEEPTRGKIQPYVIYVGKCIYLETRAFRGKTYCSLFRCDEGSTDPKNRFNVEVTQIATLKQALSALENHIKKSK